MSSIVKGKDLTLVFLDPSFSPVQPDDRQRKTPAIFTTGRKRGVLPSKLQIEYKSGDIHAGIQR